MFNANYWKDKEERKRLEILKPPRKTIFNRIMEAFFTRSTDPVYKNHTRSFKERTMRRQRHQVKMRNWA